MLIHATSFMAASSCRCSMPITMSAASCRSISTIPSARDRWSVILRPGQDAEWGRDLRESPANGSPDPTALADHSDHLSRRQPLCLSRGDGLVRSQWHLLRPRLRRHQAACQEGGRGGRRHLHRAGGERRRCRAVALPRPSTAPDPGQSLAVSSPGSRRPGSAVIAAMSSPTSRPARPSGSTMGYIAVRGQAENLVKFHKRQLASDQHQLSLAPGQSSPFDPAHRRLLADARCPRRHPQDPGPRQRRVQNAPPKAPENCRPHHRNQKPDTRRLRHSLPFCLTGFSEPSRNNTNRPGDLVAAWWTLTHEAACLAEPAIHQPPARNIEPKRSAEQSRHGRTRAVKNTAVHAALANKGG